MRVSSLLCRHATIRGATTATAAVGALALTPAAVHSPARAFSFKIPFLSNLFSDIQAGGDVARTQHEAALRGANQSASLHNERLLDACLDIMELCGGTSTSGGLPRVEVDPESRQVLMTLSEVLLHKFTAPPWEQFDLVYAALCLPVARLDDGLYASLLVVLESIVPLPLYNLFVENSGTLVVVPGDSGDGGGQGTEQQRRHVLSQFVHALLGDLHAPEGLEEEEVLSVYTDDFIHAFPEAAASQSFRELQADVTGLAMRAKLFCLLGQLCAEFDQGNTGKVRLVELREAAERVLGKDQAALLLQGAPVDAEGRLHYPQLASLLTRPPPKRSSTGGGG